MYRAVLIVAYTSLTALILPGCLGVAVNSPIECVNETPYTGVHDLFGKAPVNTDRLTPETSTKAEFLKEWGKPAEVITAAKGEEVWIYKRNLWCGVIPFVIIPIPLTLPVCDGFDKLYFVDDKPKRLHTRHTSTDIFFISIGGGGGASDPICKYPIPYDSSNPSSGKPPFDSPYSVGDKIPDNAGLVIFYRTNSILGAAGVHTVHVNGNFIVPLYNDSYYPYLSTLGEMEFWIYSFFTKKSLKINIQPGQKYYVRVKIGFSKFDFQQVPNQIAEGELTGLKLISSP